ncbi:hypothetical protein P389DRAFT_196039 [Cystobasidium minutum MCA 4210]|uniref:uncharacterized protein n=1 Tax=Cystobasidium minutum MCA 4210 TaxID=1397322 RepID=UPI0034CF7647|eukprot:jgi/Rhomi1/196039/gm1.4253_g
MKPDYSHNLAGTRYYQNWWSRREQLIEQYLPSGKDTLDSTELAELRVAQYRLNYKMVSIRQRKCFLCCFFRSVVEDIKRYMISSGYIGRRGDIRSKSRNSIWAFVKKYCKAHQIDFKWQIGRAEWARYKASLHRPSLNYTFIGHSGDTSSSDNSWTDIEGQNKPDTRNNTAHFAPGLRSISSRNTAHLIENPIESQNTQPFRKSQRIVPPDEHSIRWDSALAGSGRTTAIRGPARPAALPSASVRNAALPAAASVRPIPPKASLSRIVGKPIPLPNELLCLLQKSATTPAATTTPIESLRKAAPATSETVSTGKPEQAAKTGPAPTTTKVASEQTATDGPAETVSAMPTEEAASGAASGTAMSEQAAAAVHLQATSAPVPSESSSAGSALPNLPARPKVESNEPVSQASACPSVMPEDSTMTEAQPRTEVMIVSPGQPLQNVPQNPIPRTVRASSAPALAAPKTRSLKRWLLRLPEMPFDVEMAEKVAQLLLTVGVRSETEVRYLARHSSARAKVLNGVKKDLTLYESIVLESALEDFK